jgi:hypothetical protein
MPTPATQSSDRRRSIILDARHPTHAHFELPEALPNQSEYVREQCQQNDHNHGHAEKPKDTCLEHDKLLSRLIETTANEHRAGKFPIRLVRPNFNGSDARLPLTDSSTRNSLYVGTAGSDAR